MKKLAYIISKLTFWGFLIFCFILIPLSAFSFLEYYFNWNFPFVDIVKRDELDFAKIKNIGVEFWLTYTVFLMWGTLIYYSIYFYVLKGFFKIFITQKTFEENSLKKLTLFYKINYIPVIIGFIGIVIRYFMFNSLRFDEPHFFVLMHLILAFFLYFYLDLIRKGNFIQQENDLTI